MANELKYKLTVAEKIRDMIQAVFGDAFHTYRVGDPIRVTNSELPAIFVTETGLQVAQDATGLDGLIHTIIIQVVFSKKDELGRPKEGNTLDTIIDNWVYGRDPDNDEYSDNSILGILRTNYTMDNMTIQQEVTVTKTLVLRTNSEEDTTAEATIRIEVHELQPVNNRT